MTAAASFAAPTTAGPGYLVGQVWPTARWLLGRSLFLALWFWGLVVVAVTAATVVVAVVGEPAISILAFARHGAIWFPFAVFITVSGAYLPVHVAAGLTRRSMALGAILAAAATAVVYGVVFSVLLVVERAVYSAAGWQWQFFDDLSAGAGPGTFVPASLVTSLVANLSGLLVGMAFQRGGGWWGTVTLPVTAGPILLVSALFAADTGPIATDTWFGGRGLSVPVAVTGGLLVAAAMAFAFDRLARGATVPVRAT
ncbi:hypothetical protein Cch01nite_28070 [Cellulomonas chitinilytica]|uniref:Uncharacterized protein n=1 Tax=Cellulomonas chitinilytica TaxID=398759 RepID=A0A919P2J7_9CELL|nr:hypothetical protein [Cellulomonas chitinilytica]GIG22083.1 hypothetical protein Cch01nite_28070 [Cellulomonas chitinilytica]